MNYRMILDHIIAGLLSVITLKNLFTVEIFSGIDTIIMFLAIGYSVYVYMVYWDITKN